MTYFLTGWLKKNDRFVVFITWIFIMLSKLLYGNALLIKLNKCILVKTNSNQSGNRE